MLLRIPLSPCLSARTGLSPSAARRSGRFRFDGTESVAVLQPRGCHEDSGGLGSSPFARHYSGNHCLFSLPAGTKMFQFPAFAAYAHLHTLTAIQADGLSHSETRGSTATCAFPRIIAACHVLHRL